MLLIYQVIIVVSIKTGNKKPLPIFLLTRVISGRQSFQFLYINVAITNKIIVSQNVKAKVICIIITPFCLSFLIMQIAYAFYFIMSSQIPFIFLCYYYLAIIRSSSWVVWCCCITNIIIVIINNVMNIFIKLKFIRLLWCFLVEIFATQNTIF